MSHKLPYGFLEWRRNKFLYWIFLGDIDGWTSVGRSGRVSLESLNDLKSVKKIGFQFQRENI